MGNNNISRREMLSGVGAGLGALTIGTGSVTADEGPTEYNVGTASPAAERAARNAAENVIRVLDWDGNKKTVTGVFSEEAIKRLDKRPNVRYTEVNGEMHAIAQTLPWGVDRVDAEVAHANGETGGDNSDGEGGADIAIIDTGIDSDHPDLDVNLGTGKAIVECEPLSSRRGGCGFGIKTNDNPCNTKWDDDNDHGSHVSGSADADDDSSDVVGVSTEATLHAVKVLNACGSGSYSDVAAGIDWVAEQGYDVANMSLGGGKSYVVEDAVEYAYEHGVLLVGAAGNFGPC
ncbi:MAG: S8 family serine peptidase, partial [Halobacteriaceae archaeon]